MNDYEIIFNLPCETDIDRLPTTSFLSSKGGIWHPMALRVSTGWVLPIELINLNINKYYAFGEPTLRGLYVMEFPYLARARLMANNEWKSFVLMSQNFLDWKEGSKVAPLIETPKTQMNVVVDLVLCHLVASSYDPIHESNHLNHTNMKVVLIWVLEASIKISYFVTLV